MTRHFGLTARTLAAAGAIIPAAGALGTGLAVNAASPTSVNLGTAGSFGVLAGAGITNAGSTTINGDVGTYPTTTETGFPRESSTGRITPAMR